ncbi:hypothetical protein CR513_43913, partial [Mucuna pruriens]
MSLPIFLKYSVNKLNMKRSDHGIEFENFEFKSLCEKNSIFHNFSSLNTPKQNECFILNTKNQIGKFDSKVDKGIFLRYLDTLKPYRVFNFITFVVEESIHVKFNDRLTSNRRLSDLKDNFSYIDLIV